MPHLPAEVLLNIANHVNDTRHKFNLALTCRHYYEVLIPVLYSEIRLSGPRAGGKAKNVKSLVQALLQKPGLAKFVRKLEIASWGVKRCSSARADAGREAALRDFVGRLSRDEKKKESWIADLRTGLPVAWVALLLFQLNETLQELSLYVPRHLGAWEPHLKFIFEGSARREAPFDTIVPFPNLERVFTIWESHTHRDSDKYTCPLFTLPALKAVSVVGWFESRPEKGIEEYTLTPGSSGVTHISVEQGRCPFGFAEVIAACKELKSFRWLDDPMYIPGKGFSRPEKLLDSLQSAKTSLESLWLEFGLRSVNPWSNNLIGSFADFTALTRLRITARQLFKTNNPTTLHDVLPEKLVSLYLGGFDDRNKPEVSHIHELQSLVAVNSHLQQLHLECEAWCAEWGSCWYRESDYRSLIAGLSVECKEKGIDFRVVHSWRWGVPRIYDGFFV